MSGLLQFVPSTGRPILHNDDGTVSTEESITVTDPRLNGGRPTNIPSIWNGQRTVSQNAAIEAALASGQTFQSFGSIDEAVEAAKARSQALGNEIDAASSLYPSANSNVISFHERTEPMQSYAGLLNDPRMAGLLGAAGGLLGASGPTPYKVGLGGMMGQGLGGALSGMMGAEQYKADSEMREMMKRFMEQQLGNGMFGGAMPTTPARPTAQMQPAGMSGMGMMPQPQATGMPRPLTISGFGGF